MSGGKVSNSDSKILNKIKSIDSGYKLVFLCSIISGLISHSIGLFNKLSIHDDLYYFFDIGQTMASGRWMLAFLGYINKLFYGTEHYSLPLFNGILAILYLALASCLIVRILDIKDSVMCSFVGLFMVSFPAVTSMMGYSFTLKFYCFGLLIGLLGVYLLIKKEIICKIAGTILFTLSLGVYQALMPIIICVLLIRLILDVIDIGKAKKVLFDILISGVSLVVSFLGYLLVTNICNNAFNIKLDDYQGISSMTDLSIAEIFRRIAFSYTVFFNPRVEGRNFAFPNNILVLYVFVIVILALSCLLCFINLIKNSRIHALIFIVLCAAFPIACNFVCIMADYSAVHSLMIYGQLAPYIMCLTILDRIPENYERKYLFDAGIVFLCAIMIMYVRFNNICYLKAQVTQNELFSYYSTLVTQIKSTEGYKDEYPVVVINPQTINDSSITGLEEFEYIHNVPFYDYYIIVNDYTWNDYIRIWCGYEPEWVLVYDYEGGIAEYDEMASYPDYGSIKVIDENVVVKFS